MKVYTDVSTLSSLFPLFKEAGIEGVLTGDLSKIKDLDLPDLAGLLLEKGKLPEICEIITKSDVCEEETGAVAWAECSLIQCLGVFVPFVIDITVGPIELNQMLEMAQTTTEEISS
ncbi:MAG: hypothetical protein PHC50_07360 [Candidatus Cloacimonetes bacterium]|nr:hypothetical protein [Candidatus Cloacimonadota bacterium]MDD3535944.1 hypothetical protein [Candidatus Cloacimonadota bacterium]